MQDDKQYVNNISINNMSWETTEYTKNLVTKIQTKQPPHIPPKPSYFSTHNQTRTESTVPNYPNTRYPKTTTAADYANKISSSSKESQNARGPHEHSVLSGSSSTSNLAKNDLVKGVMYKNKQLEGKYLKLQTDHVKLQKRYEDLLRQSTLLKEKYDHLSANLKLKKVTSFDRSEVQEVVHQQHTHRTGCDSFQISQMPVVQNFLKTETNQIQTPQKKAPEVLKISRECQTQDNWKLEAALRDKQRLEMQNLSLRSELDSLRNRMDTYLQTNTSYSSELEMANAELKEKLSKYERISQIREIVSSGSTGYQEKSSFTTNKSSS